MKENPFSEFPPVSPEQWKRKIIDELKGKPFDDLIWHTPEGFDIQPFYTAEDLEKIKITVPKKKTSGWEVRQDFVVKDLRDANKQALNALQSGADSLGFDVSKGEIMKVNLPKLFAGMNLSKHPVHFKGVKMKSVGALVSNLNTKTSGSVEFSDFAVKQLPLLIEPIYKFPAFHFITISSAADSAVNQLTEVLQKASAILQYCSQSKTPLKQVSSSMRVSLTLGSDYFMEIAKLRALRVLWMEMLGRHDMKAAPLFIHAENSLTKTEKGQEHFNILRATTTAMAAITGGCDSLSLKDSPIPKKPKSFSERIYRNIQLLLKYESYFDKISDAGGGSFYIETLTASLAEKARLEMNG